MRKRRERKSRRNPAITSTPRTRSTRPRRRARMAYRLRLPDQGLAMAFSRPRGRSRKLTFNLLLAALLLVLPRYHRLLLRRRNGIRKRLAFPEAPLAHPVWIPSLPPPRVALPIFSASRADLRGVRTPATGLAEGFRLQPSAQIFSESSNIDRRWESRRGFRRIVPVWALRSPDLFCVVL